jgi:3-hydroxyisobutyrate dehydrogenase-like beta-hydroxyacid dehydrogenase
MKQLSGLDASFLYMETPEMPMHVGALHLFELPASYKGSFLDDVRRHIGSRLPLAPALSRKLDKIRSDQYVPSFTLSLMRKDVRLVTEAARRRHVELRVVAGATRWIEEAEQHGLGGCDYSAVVAQIRRRDVTC